MKNEHNNKKRALTFTSLDNLLYQQSFAKTDNIPLPHRIKLCMEKMNKKRS